ncbi:AAA family ATPase [Sphingobacterium daejeonense]|uniref:AAA family ATPase n=1 Tax=Sphingobacterium daejeonense TaxID=371142 RepID=UPI0010C50D97|nr:AAA family ATPase [Sphingobacterium daejeonense]VTQ00289.1 Uncharacterised protein [Sphingobacterium daejeonense]
MGAPKLKALEIQKAVEQSFNSFQQPDINDKLLDLLKKSELNPDSNFDKPESVLSIMQPNGEVPMFVRGSISQINGKAKSGKSTFLTIAVANAINGSDYDEEVSFIAKGNIRVLWFDTEQGGYYAHRTYKMTLAKLKSDKLLLLKYFDLREHDAETRLKMIQLALEINQEIGLVIIDGTRDLLYDYNDPKESSKLVTELMRLSTTYNCHIVNVLHLNKSNGESRGHLGTELDNKCTLTMVVNKLEDTNGASIETKLNRDAPILPIELIREDDGEIYLREGFINRSGNKAEPITLLDEDHMNILKEVFTKKSEYNSGEFSSELKKTVSSYINRSAPDSFIRPLIKQYQAKGFVSFQGGGNKRSIKLVESVNKLPN